MLLKFGVPLCKDNAIDMEKQFQLSKLRTIDTSGWLSELKRFKIEQIKQAVGEVNLKNFHMALDEFILLIEVNYVCVCTSPFSITSLLFSVINLCIIIPTKIIIITFI